MTCGHTHLPMVAEHEGVHYINSGTWTETPPCPFVAVLGKEVRLEYWPMAETVIGQAAEEEVPLAPPLLNPPPLPAMG